MVIQLIAYLILTVSGLILFKIGGARNCLDIGIEKINMSISITSLIGIMCYAASFLLWLHIIEKSKISYIFPIANGLVTILTILGGVVLLHEKVNQIQLIGIVCIIIGVIITNLFK